MRKILFALAAVILCSSHDMYLKLDGFFLEPNTPANIQLFNGTFAKSDNTIDRSRMLDCSLLGNGRRTKVDTTQWSEQGDVTVLGFTTGEAGTWVAGVSTKARDFKMEAQAFNDYLKHDGVLDALDRREKNGTLGQDATERYSKHVKTIFQVGDTRTTDWQTALGYPIEFIPLSNPYDLHAGDMLSVKLLRQGKPLAGELVYVDHEPAAHDHDHADGHSHAHGDDAAHQHGATGHSHAHGDNADLEHGEAGHSHHHDGDAAHEHEKDEEEHHHASATQYRTAADGTFTFEVSEDGTWQVRTIHLVDSDEAGLTHESNWATLTFALDHDQKHSHTAADHHHDDHEHEAGIPAYVYWGGSLLLLAGLFVWFNRKDG